MPQCILFIDGENFLHKLGDVLKEKSLGKSIIAAADVNLEKLFKSALQDLRPTRKIFYASKIHLYPETKKKSEELIKAQRKLRNSLTKHGFEFIIAGNVRAQKVGQKVFFKEKGVDVKIAVDMVSLVCDKKLDTAILCSSDSDLQPAVKELRIRGVEVVYLGFEMSPNKGLSYTTSRTILIRKLEVADACKD